jgi:hypothetical protein
LIRESPAELELAVQPHLNKRAAENLRVRAGILPAIGTIAPRMPLIQRFI